jgi:predicted dehydrogenase
MAFRIGLMGCGSVADFGHLPAIGRCSEFELVGLFDPVRGRAASYSAKFGGKAFESDEEFFSQPMDAVAICSPLAAHFDNVMLASQHGVHVLCEKPIAVNEEEAADMIAVMEDSGKGFFVGLVYRFSHVAAQLKKWLRDGTIGDVRHIRMQYLWNLHGQWVQDSAGNWVESPLWRGRMLEGGPLIDCGVHQIDLIRWMTGREVVSCDGFGAWLAKYDAPDHVTCHLALEGGITASVEVSFTYGHTVREPVSYFTYELIGTGGVARFDRNGYVLEARTGEQVLRSEGASEKNFDGMYHQFGRYVASGEVGSLASPDDALVATKIAIDCTDRAICKRIV